MQAWTVWWLFYAIADIVLFMYKYQLHCTKNALRYSNNFSYLLGKRIRLKKYTALSFLIPDSWNIFFYPQWCSLVNDFSSCHLNQ